MATTLDIDTLRSLIAIVDLKSFSRAADRLGRTQSAISLQIARLEGLVGHAVIARVRGRVTGPTARGATLLAHAREMVALNERAIAAMRRPADAKLRLGLPADILERDFAATLDEIRARFPKLQLTLRTDLSARLTDDLDQGRLDLAIFKRAPSNQAGAAISSEPMAWFSEREFQSTARDDEPLPLIVFGDGCAYRAEALRSLDLAQRDWTIACEAQSFAALLAAVDAGLGYAALPMRLGARRALTVVDDLPELNPVELALGIAEGCEIPFVQDIGAVIAERCALA